MALATAVSISTFTVPSGPISTSCSATNSGGCCGCGHQNGIGRRQPQCGQPGYHRIVVGKPPIAGPVKPIPRPGRIPAPVVARAVDLILHLGLGHRRAEVVFGLDRGGDFFAQHHRLGRRVDGHLELRLLVLLDAEAAAAESVDPWAAARNDDAQPVDAQRGVGGDDILALDAAVGVGLLLLRNDFSPLGLWISTVKSLAGKLGSVRPCRIGHGGPRTCSCTFCSGPIDGPVGDRVDLRGVVLVRRIAWPYQTPVKPK